MKGKDGKKEDIIDFSKDTIDLTSQKAPEVVPTLKTGPRYDPRPQQDTARRRIAYALIGLLWVIIAALLVLIYIEGIEVKDLKEFAVILGPVVTLVSAATGFYYGTKTIG